MIFTVLWITWILLFVVVEGVALVRKDKGDTLSEHVWKVLRVRDDRPTPMAVVGRILLGAGIIWLFVHLVFGI